MRNPLTLATRFIQALKGSEPAAPDIQTLKIEIAEVVNSGFVELSRQSERRFEEKLGAVHSSLRERLDDIYSETWRLRDALDSKLASVEQRLETSTSRVEASVLEIHASAASVKETCHSLARTFDRQFSSTEEAVHSLKESYERRVRQLEASQHSKLSALESEYRQTLHASTGSQQYVLDRVRSLAEQMLRAVERAPATPGVEALGGSFLSTSIQKLAKRLQGDRLEQLEGTLRTFALRLSELGQVEEARAPKAHHVIQVSPGLAAPELVAAGARNNGNGNGNGHHSFELNVSGLARS